MIKLRVETMRRLFLDDIRNPPDDGNEWIVVRSYSDAVKYVEEHGVPDFISFDHDLGFNPDDTLNRTGMDFAKWLTYRHLSRRYTFPEGFGYTVHSANPIGASNIRGLLDMFLKYLEEERAE